MAIDDQDLDLEVAPALPAELVVDHCALALRRLISQYRGQPNIEAVLCLAGDRFRDLDTHAQLVLAHRGIETAFGAGLDRLGVLLRWRRDGLTDDAYRVRLRAAAQVRASRGRPDDVLGVLITLLDGAATPTAEEHYPAAVVLEVLGIPNVDGWAFARLLRRATAAGVLLQLLHEEDGVLLFGWEDDADSDGGEWAESDTDTDGGVWAEASGLPGAA